MSAWTTFGLVKLFLDIVDSGPSAIVKGILMSGVPSPIGEIVDIGELLFGLFDLNGNYRGTVTLQKDQYVPLANIKLLNKDRLETSMATYDFPKLARREFTKMENKQFKKRNFPKF